MWQGMKIPEEVRYLPLRCPGYTGDGPSGMERWNWHEPKTAGTTGSVRGQGGVRKSR